MRIFTLFLCLIPAFAAVSRAPSSDGGATCSSRPCVYTVTGVSGVGTISEIQTAVDDAQRGDTIKLEAGTVWNHNTVPTPAGALWLDRKPAGASGRVLITTTEDAKLPNPGTRITPAYKPLMPVLKITSSMGNGPHPYIVISSAWEGRTGFRTPGVAAAHWELRGIAFYAESTGNMYQPSGQRPDLSDGFIRAGKAGVVHGPTSRFGAGFLFTALTVSGGVATATSSHANLGLAVGDIMKIGGLVGAGTALNGLHTVTSVPTGSTYTFATAVADGTYTESAMYMIWGGAATHYPSDIVIDRCIFQQDGLTLTRRAIGSAPAGLTVKDSWLNTSRVMTSDGQEILVLGGPGPVTMENNYIAGPSSENFMSGGGANALMQTTADFIIRYNYFSNNPWQGWTRRWALMKTDADPLIFKGRTLRHPSLSITYIALNSGQLGPTEPDWTACDTTAESPCTVSETAPGTVVWAFNYPASLGYITKNLFETKDVLRMVVKYNVFSEKITSDTQQPKAINFKAEQQSLYANDFGNSCVPSLSGQVDTNNTIVTRAAADTSTFPWQSNTTGAGGYDTNGNEIVIAGVTYTIASFDSATQLTLTTSAGSQSGATYRYGPDPAVRLCLLSETKDVSFEHNVVQDSASAMSINVGTNGHLGSTGPLSIRHNLIQRMDPLRYTSGTGATINTPYNVIFTAPIFPQTTIEHNTVFSTSGGYAYQPDETGGRKYLGDAIIRNNLFGYHPSGAIRNLYSGGLTPYHCATPCPPAQWGNNIFAGNNITTYSAATGTTMGNLCAATSGCASEATVNYAGHLRDKVAYNYRIKASSSNAFNIGGITKGLQRTSYTGTDIGVDYSQLPQINDLKITPTDRAVMFQYRVTEPISHIPCVVEVSKYADFLYPLGHAQVGTASYEGELGAISTYYRQDADDADRFVRRGYSRMIVVGHTVNLTAGTLHYYQLHCGGDMRKGTFTTLGTLTGTAAQTVVQPVTGTLTWGYTRSNSGDTITGGGTVACTSGAACSFTATKGRIVYWRVGTGRIGVLAAR